MARRLTWLAIGVGLTVVAVRKGRSLADTYLPAGATDTIDGVQRVSHAVVTLRTQFATAMAEREQQLRHDLVGDVDVDELRAQRPERVADLRRSWDSRHAGAGRVGPTEDPDDDDGYTFF
ncbi:hypothetical protein [Cellulomonas fengjieae]|uniref:Uncharacterized protein n=1 Tax=Cellulomonas fengjieae TaxID=2819978 RepID=A0ABS3SKM5_9CELL|nr:hypothetical protein [Cellulomonas fengjieae]MBO3085535.1 hypothetical protein [Cellulomonas fengjieae]MBO3102643.1 hypothetical protein [Cellulomonas fengjieae]QVI64424.1 hypothetical protein KG102_09380 [Cellulomonas fengjieae]